MPDLHASDYGALRAFAAVAEALSYSRAAATLGVSASSLSQTIQGLEERLAMRLLNRTTRSVSLTQAGDLLLRRIRPAIDELGAALEDARKRAGRVEGALRVYAFPIAADLFIAPMLLNFVTAYPGISLELTLVDQVADLVTGGFDAGFLIGEVLNRDMEAISLGQELRQIAVASPVYLAIHGRPKTPQQLLDHQCIRWHWRGKAKPYDWEFCREGRWFSVAVDGPLVADRRDFCIDAAVNGLGIAFAIESVVAEHIANGLLVPLLEDWSAPFPGFFLCYPRQHIMPRQLKAFVEVFGKLPQHTHSGNRS